MRESMLQVMERTAAACVIFLVLFTSRVTGSVLHVLGASETKTWFCPGFSPPHVVSGWCTHGLVSCQAQT